MTSACLLSMVGGLMDVYTYVCRGKVFANAATGNMVLFGFNLADADWAGSAKYLLPICFYALGVFAAQEVREKASAGRRLSWHQTVVLIEAACLLPAALLPFGGVWDGAVNAVVSFVCALQVQTFRRVHGLPFASTMCTGNLRSGTDALFEGIRTGNRDDFATAIHYYAIIACFIAGAALGALAIRLWGPMVILAAPLGLLEAAFLIRTRR